MKGNLFFFNLSHNAPEKPHDPTSLGRQCAATHPHSSTAAAAHAPAGAQPAPSWDTSHEHSFAPNRTLKIKITKKKSVCSGHLLKNFANKLYLGAQAVWLHIQVIV